MIKSNKQLDKSNFRCDGKTDCKDSSDELDCKVLEIDSSYNKFLSPPLPESTKSGYINVFCSFYIHSLDSFDPVGGNYAVKFTLQLKWKDPRLFFNNLRFIHYMILLLSI